MNKIPTQFTSNNHKRYENGVWTGKNNLGANRGLLFEKVNDEVYQVSMHLLDGSLSNFGDNVQMAAKPMKIISQTENKIVLRGFGYDELGYPFSDYGVELNYTNGNLDNVTLNMYDRNVSINYFNSPYQKKTDNKKDEKTNSYLDGLAEELNKKKEELTLEDIVRDLIEGAGFEKTSKIFDNILPSLEKAGIDISDKQEIRDKYIINIKENMKIKISLAEQGNFPFSFNDETWEFVKGVEGGNFFETNDEYTIQMLSGVKLIFKRNEPLVVSPLYNRHRSADAKLFEVCELVHSEYGNFLLYRFKKEDKRNTFILTGIAGIMSSSNIYFTIE